MWTGALAVVRLDKVEVCDDSTFSVGFDPGLVVRRRGLKSSEQRRPARCRERRRLGLQAEMFKDLLNRRLVLDHSEQLATTTTMRTSQDVYSERARKELGPGHSPLPFLLAIRRWRWLALHGRSPRDERTPPRARRELAVKAHEVGARRRQQRDHLGDQVLWLEELGKSAIAPIPLQS